LVGDAWAAVLSLATHAKIVAWHSNTGDSSMPYTLHSANGTGG
jgi:hypothetical protein